MPAAKKPAASAKAPADPHKVLLALMSEVETLRKRVDDLERAQSSGSRTPSPPSPPSSPSTPPPPKPTGLMGWLRT